MKSLTQSSVQLLLNFLSFLTQKGILKGDRAFTFFQSLPIPASTIREILTNNYVFVDRRASRLNNAKSIFARYTNH